jgi:hypothetical protein
LESLAVSFAYDKSGLPVFDASYLTVLDLQASLTFEILCTADLGLCRSLSSPTHQNYLVFFTFRIHVTSLIAWSPPIPLIRQSYLIKQTTNTSSSCDSAGSYDSGRFTQCRERLDWFGERADSLNMKRKGDLGVRCERPLGHNSFTPLFFLLSARRSEKLSFLYLN